MRTASLVLLLLLLITGFAFWPSTVDQQNQPTSGPQKKQQEPAASAAQDSPPYTLLVSKKAKQAHQQTPTKSTFQIELDRVEEWLSQGQPNQAADFVNDQYSKYSSAELEQFKLLFLRERGHSALQIANFDAATRVFDDLESWNALANEALSAREWTVAYKALTRATDLENNSSALEEKLSALVRVTNYLRAGMEKQGDELGIKALYQTVYERYPSYPRFQLELAYAHIRLGEVDEATRLLNGLLYDPDFGAISQQALDQIQSQGQSASPTIDPPQQARQSADIVVPLVRSGTSFLIDTSINNRHSRLLLDTGASITALSTQLIERLNLPPTGQVIQINTANGSRSSRLFKTGNLRLGQFQLSGLVVAEIDLQHSSGFDGLLGTDALNHLSSDFNYVIDNEQNSLIFRRR